MAREGSLAAQDERFMRRALELARQHFGFTSPNPAVGAVICKDGRVIGEGSHRGAGFPHAEIEAMGAALKNGKNLERATLYVTLEPCSTWGRTGPCTEEILAHRFKRVVVAATDPNPAHNGEGLRILRNAGIKVDCGVLEREALELNRCFNHWITTKRPFVMTKFASTLDGKIATVDGFSKWITGPVARADAMKLRLECDAILVGVNTVLRDDPALTYRGKRSAYKKLRRFVLDPHGRIGLHSQLLKPRKPACIVVSEHCPSAIRKRLAKRTTVWVAPSQGGSFNLEWLLQRMGEEAILGLLVEGGGEVHAQFLKAKLASLVVLYYAHKLFCGRNAAKAVAGAGLPQPVEIQHPCWKQLGTALRLTGIPRFS